MLIFAPNRWPPAYHGTATVIREFLIDKTDRQKQYSLTLYKDFQFTIVVVVGGVSVVEVVVV